MASANETSLIIQGQGYLDTAVAWNDTANSTGGTFLSALVAISASNFRAYDISFQVVFSSWNSQCLIHLWFVVILMLINSGVLSGKNTASPPSLVEVELRPWH